MSEQIYTFEQKQKLADKIHKIKNEQDLIMIQNMIIKHNPSIKITTNKFGNYMFFHNLEQKTYYTIEKLISKISKREDNEDTTNDFIKSITGSVCIEASANTDSDIFASNPRLKYNNKEKNLMKRKKYDELVISQNAPEKNKDLQDIFNKKK